jgi:hypothetical protein
LRMKWQRNINQRRLRRKGKKWRRIYPKCMLGSQPGGRMKIERFEQRPSLRRWIFLPGIDVSSESLFTTYTDFFIIFLSAWYSSQNKVKMKENMINGLKHL